MTLIPQISKKSKNSPPAPPHTSGSPRRPAGPAHLLQGPVGRPLHTEEGRGRFKSHDEAPGRAHTGVDGRRQRQVSRENEGADMTGPHHEAFGEESDRDLREGPARRESSRHTRLRRPQTADHAPSTPEATRGPQRLALGRPGTNAQLGTGLGEESGFRGAQAPQGASGWGVCGGFGGPCRKRERSLTPRQSLTSTPAPPRTGPPCPHTQTHRHTHTLRSMSS